MTLTYSYDGTNKLTQKTVPASTTSAPGYSVFYGYDVNGLQLYARFGSASGPGITTAYDGFGRVTSSTSNMDGTARSTLHQYDAGGNTLVLSGDAGYNASFTYSAANEMTAYQGVFQIGYDSAGRRAGVYMGPGSSTTSWTTYGYDAVGRLQTQAHGLTDTTGNQSVTLGYNPASQITSEARTNNAYAYTGATNVAWAYQVNGLNQYSAVGPNAYTYDANGNLLSDGVNSYSYDAENRLVSRSGGVALSYDPNGRLWQVSGPSSLSRFLYDGDQLVQEYNASGTPTGAYVYGSGVDEPLTWYSAAGRRHLHADHQGSITAIADDAGNKIAINAYDPWGVPNSANIGRFGYTGQVWLPELGMWYYKARIYSPMIGRFLQTDPIGYQGGNNLYAYVSDDPVNGSDPSGLATPEQIEEASRSVHRLIGAIERDIRDAQSPKIGSHFQSSDDRARVDSLKTEVAGLKGLDPAQLADMRVGVSDRAAATGLAGTLTGAKAEQVYTASSVNGNLSIAPARMSSRTLDSGNATYRGTMLMFGHKHQPGGGREYAGVGDPGNVLLTGKPMIYTEGRNANAIGWDGTHFTLSNIAGKSPSYSSAPGWIRDTFSPW